MKINHLNSWPASLATGFLLCILMGCGISSMTKTIHLGQGNVISSSGTKSTATLEGVTLEILHPDIYNISAKSFTVSSAPDGPEIKVYEIGLGSHTLRLRGLDNALSLSVNDEPHSPVTSGTILKIDQDGTVTVIKTGAAETTPDQAPK
jgi:hypothetical protein